MDLVAAAPKGFFASCEVLNCLPEGVLSELALGTAKSSDPTSVQNVVRSVAASLQGSVGAGAAAGATKSPSLAQLGGAANALLIVFREAKKAGLTSAEALQGALAQVVQAKPAAIIAAAWQAAAKTQQETPESKTAASAPAGGGLGLAQGSGLALGTVVGLDWKVGVGICSNDCAALKAPYVSLVFKIADASGVHHQPMELTVPQFQQLRASFEALSAHLDSA